MKKILIAILGMSLVGSAFAAVDGKLSDVTDGQEIRGIVTPSNATGHATVNYAQGDFQLNTSFKYLADPIGDDFYEGWLVRQSPFAFISTGVAEKVNGYYENNFISDIDYRDYDTYVLTLEPNDGNPAPAEHILEGKVLEVKGMSSGEPQGLIVDESLKNNNTQEIQNATNIDTQLTERQEILKVGIKKKLESIDTSKIDPEIIYTKIQEVRNSIDERGFSLVQKKSYLEFLDVIEVVIWEIS